MLVNSGASIHVVSDINYLLYDVKRLEKEKQVSCANKNSEANLKITHEGKLKMIGINGKEIILNEVFYSENSSKKLIER